MAQVISMMIKETWTNGEGELSIEVHPSTKTVMLSKNSPGLTGLSHDKVQRILLNNGWERK